MAPDHHARGLDDLLWWTFVPRLQSEFGSITRSSPCLAPPSSLSLLPEARKLLTALSRIMPGPFESSALRCVYSLALASHLTSALDLLEVCRIDCSTLLTPWRHPVSLALNAELYSPRSIAGFFLGLALTRFPLLFDKAFACLVCLSPCELLPTAFEFALTPCDASDPLSNSNGHLALQLEDRSPEHQSCLCGLSS